MQKVYAVTPLHAEAPLHTNYLMKRSIEAGIMQPRIGGYIIKTFYEQNYNGARHPITDEKFNRSSMVGILDNNNMRHVYNK